MRRLLIGILFAIGAWAQSEAPVRYIVQLQEEPTVKAESLGEAPAARNARVASEQQLFESRLASYAPGAHAIARTRAAINAVIVEGVPGQLQSLAAMPGVKRVEQARLLKQHMDTAIHTHLLTVGWARTGGLDHAGEGIRIAIIDSGIEPEHPAFRAPDLPMPDGFPQASGPGNNALTSNKIIAMRSFDNLSARDLNGHGTAVAAAAAAVVHQSARGLFIGAAPRAYLGIYRTNVGSSGDHREDYLLQALEAALNDNMNVVNMSLGYSGLLDAEDTILAEAARNLALRNITVVVSAGNDGPEIMTSNPLAAFPEVVSVGASQNARVTTEPTVLVPTGSPIEAAPSTNATEASPVSGQLVDVVTLDGNGLACNALPAGSLEGFIPLIMRGTCSFADKLANAAAAGATGGIVYNDPARPDAETLTGMDVTTNPTIPGLFVRASDGLRLKQELAASEEYQVVLRFLSASNNPNRLAGFSSLGPPVNLTIKPDLVATGANLYTATQTTNPNSGLYSANGYITLSGTSFSAPIVAGSAAVLRRAKPGLYPNDYRSLLINSAVPFVDGAGVPVPVQWAGNGSLNMDFAVRSTLTADPVSLSFGAQDATFSTWRQVILRNISVEPRSYTLSVETADTVRPFLTSSQVTLNPGEIAGPVLVFEGGAIPPGAYQGRVRIEEPESGITTRVPYWLAVKSTVPARISLPAPPEDSRAGDTTSFYVRVHDSAGLMLTEPKPEIETVTGSGSFVSVDPSGFYPGSWFVIVRLSGTPGLNQFRVRAGAVSRTISITGAP